MAARPARLREAARVPSVIAAPHRRATPLTPFDKLRVSGWQIPLMVSREFTLSEAEGNHMSGLSRAHR